MNIVELNFPVLGITIATDQGHDLIGSISGDPLGRDEFRLGQRLSASLNLRKSPIGNDFEKVGLLNASRHHGTPLTGTKPSWTKTKEFSCENGGPRNPCREYNGTLSRSKGHDDALSLFRRRRATLPLDQFQT
jgi:hypothetical protein